ncbi:hypothetical protein N8745_01585 [Candidatus Pelagibacter sp.]|nr:hypothetical protein [Candidatus Pelagibacter sp.]
MTKILTKSILFLLLILILAIFYLSYFGVKTEKLNEKIIDKISKINKKAKVELNFVKYVLDIRNLSIIIKTSNPKISIDKNKLEFKSLKTQISLRSFMKDQFLIDDLQISTKDIKLSDVLLLARSFKNSAELFILSKIIKDGSLVANIGLNFNANGTIKEDYKIDGVIKNGKIRLLDNKNLSNLNFSFKIKKDEYLLNDLEVLFKKIKFTIPKMKITEKNNLFLINGKLINKEKDLDYEFINNIFDQDFKNFDLNNINFHAESDFNIEVNKKFKINNIELFSKLNLKKLSYSNKFLKLKKYFPEYNQLVNLTNHEILINYKNNQIDITGNGELSLEDKTDKIKYKIAKKNDQYNFNINFEINDNSLIIDFLDYKKKENLSSYLKLDGIYRKDNKINFKSILLTENDNSFLVKDLYLSDKLKIIDVRKIKIDYFNLNGIKNNISLTKNKKNYKIQGQSFDATKLINELLESQDDESSSIFDGLNSTIDITINKTYLDKVTFVNNLSGNIYFKDNKIYKLNLDSKFSDNKKLVITINTTDNNEKITTLFSDYPKSLLKQYKFIKGFEEGVLDFYSIKKDNISNSLLVIDNFKVQEIPILAKLLTLASLQGIADLLTGEGIRFTDLEMKFSNDEGLMRIEEMYAIGPAISILMDGYIEPKKLISLRGTLVPATTINRSIASIPIIGNILIGKKTGEGVFGVSFKIKGPPKNLKTTVNPVKTLTPRFITRTLEKIKKN